MTGTDSTPTNRKMLKGRELLNDPALNKGTAFSDAERRAYDLEGLLPHPVESLEDQRARLRLKFSRLHDDLERHIFLRAVQDTNQTLFYSFVDENLTEMLPILYTPTVGLASQEFSNIYRRPLGMFVSYPNRDRMTEQFESWEDDVDVIVVTDGERILGLGDQGIGGMGIPIGKLSLYTAAGGVAPERTLPIVLDVGTNNQELLDDPLYLGWRNERIVGKEYDDFIEQFVDTLTKRFPNVLLQWEDFASHHATTLLERYRDRALSFNDDIQGTAAVALAAVHAAVDLTGSRLADQRVCIAGAGSAGTGIAGMLADAMGANGVEHPENQIFLTDSEGLLHSRRDDLADYQTRFAQSWDNVAGWAESDGPTSLDTVVSEAKPTVLIGVSGQSGVFTQSMIETMAQSTERPVVMPLSNPTSHAEATPEDLMAWTNGKALIATGSPFDPVMVDGVPHTISQSNNIYVFPGLGQGAIVCNASTVSDNMLRVAALAVADNSPCKAGTAADGILPPLDQVQTVSRRIALAVAQAARDDGVGDDVDDAEFEARLDRAWWRPTYRSLD